MTAGAQRSVVLVVHVKRPGATAAAHELGERLVGAGLSVRVLATEAEDIGCAGADVVADDPQAAIGAELVIAFGGDGTLLRAAEYARAEGTPLLGVNLGHVGFLAEADPISLDDTAAQILAGDYAVEDRLSLDVRVLRSGEEVLRDWALNDVSVEKDSREHMVNLILEIDGRPLSRWGCDGLVCATPTGSTAYAFSAGGPVVWPSVHALLVVPISAHALFARPLVVSPGSTVAIEITDAASPGIMFCDGRRTHALTAQDRLEIVAGSAPVRLVRLRSAPFTDRLVDKFQLPVQGWSGR
ncbi:MAG TPA: NAD kinase [Mycobacteriales bacterium]|nr:NAD kinase [Mycobacteriales bacterium]